MRKRGVFLVSRGCAAGDGRRALWFLLIVVVMFGIAVAEHHLDFSR
ncbi:hypothetical protein [Bradyrhizobium zhanjiangense]|nr:hypothetical protein [Bradyrhizobium zhanjiangense]